MIALVVFFFLVAQAGDCDAALWAWQQRGTPNAGCPVVKTAETQWQLAQSAQRQGDRSAAIPRLRNSYAACQGAPGARCSAVTQQLSDSLLQSADHWLSIDGVHQAALNLQEAILLDPGVISRIPRSSRTAEKLCVAAYHISFEDGAEGSARKLYQTCQEIAYPGSKWDDMAKRGLARLEGRSVD